MRIVHIADIHLDRPFVGLGRENGDRARQRLRATFRRCLDLAREREADLVTIGGDLWEDENVVPDTRHFVARELERLNRRAILICGNHDPYLPGGNYARTDWPDNVDVMAADSPAEIRIGEISVWGISWLGGALDASFLEGFSVPADGRRHLLLLHGTAQPIAHFAAHAHCAFDPAAISRAGFDLCLAGHIHRASNRDRVVYPGSPEPLGWSETGEHCACVVTLTEGVAPEVELIRVNEHSYQQIETDCEGCASSVEVEERLSDGLPSSNASLHLRVDLQGEIGKQCVINPQALADAHSNDYAELVIRDATRPAYDLERLAEIDTVDGLFVRRIQERMATAQEEDRPLLEAALIAGLRALDGRKDVVNVD